MESWNIIKLTLIHCLVALAVIAAFGGTVYVCRFLFPNDSFVIKWLHGIDVILVVVAPTVLGIMFLSSLFRIALGTVISAWKGFLNVNANIILA